MSTLSERVNLADRLADYVRMYFEANPPMPDPVAVAWRDYQDERTAQPSLAPAVGSAETGVPIHLRAKIKHLIREAWWHGFDAAGPDQIDFIDEFALADEALDEHWPNAKVSDGCPATPTADTTNL